MGFRSSLEGSALYSGVKYPVMEYSKLRPPRGTVGWEHLHSKTVLRTEQRLHDRIAALQKSKAVRSEVSLFVAVALGASWGGSYIVGVSVDG